MIVLLIVKAVGSFVALAFIHFGGAGIFYSYCLENGLTRNRVSNVERIKAMATEITETLLGIRMLQGIAGALILAAIWWPS